MSFPVLRTIIFTRQTFIYNMSTDETCVSSQSEVSVSEVIPLDLMARRRFFIFSGDKQKYAIVTRQAMRRN